MKSFTLLWTIAPLLAASAPLVERAGGPAITPIPSNCTIINPLPHGSCGTANVSGWAPIPSPLYSAYFQSFHTHAEDARQCRQQCYGYGNTGDCKASFIAYNVTDPDTGSVGTACLLFSDYLTPLNFTTVANSTYVNATAASIYCPS